MCLRYCKAKEGLRRHAPETPNQLAVQRQLIRTPNVRDVERHLGLRYRIVAEVDMPAIPRKACVAVVSLVPHGRSTRRRSQSRSSSVGEDQAESSPTRNCHCPSSATVPFPNPSTRRGAPATGSGAYRRGAGRTKNTRKSANLLFKKKHEHRCCIVFALFALQIYQTSDSDQEHENLH